MARYDPKQIAAEAARLREIGYRQGRAQGVVLAKMFRKWQVKAFAEYVRRKRGGR